MLSCQTKHYISMVPRFLILGIETSCDETGVALYDTAEGLLADALHSQVDLHARYGGVVPEVASRRLWNWLARFPPAGSWLRFCPILACAT